MLICVVLSYMPSTGSVDVDTIAQLLPQASIVHISNSPVNELSQRQLLDQLECLQLYWGKVMEEHYDTTGQCAYALKALMRRLGYLARHAFTVEGGVLDAQQYTVVLPMGTTATDLSIVSRRYLRKACCILLMLFRTLHITSTARVIDDISDSSRDDIKGCFREHHVECSVDMFAALQQVVRLAPGMRLVYSMDFSGMYNDVSQVVFFHYPQFQRQAQVSLRLALDSALHTLPIVAQLLPEIPIVYDDEDIIPGIFSAGPRPKSGIALYWLVSCASVLLVDAMDDRTHILASPDATLIPLIAYVTSRTRKSLRVDAGGANKRARIDMTAHSHVKLMSDMECT